GALGPEVDRARGCRIRAARSTSQMPRPLLGVGNEVRDSAVHFTPTARIGNGCGCGRKQRMREPHPSLLELDEVCLDRLRDGGRGVPARDGAQQLEGWL